jgi:hypothetical protein
MITTLKKNYAWILLFGSLIGLNEMVTGSLRIPFHSVAVGSITIALLAVARKYFPQKGTSLVIIGIAMLFKMNSMGFRDCTAPAMLCGPTALALTGISFEIFASLLISGRPFRYLNHLLVCALASIFAFTLFAIVQKYFLNIWDSTRFLNYIFFRGSLAAILSGALAVTAIFVSGYSGNITLRGQQQNAARGLLFSVIIALWIFGTLSS